MTNRTPQLRDLITAHLEDPQDARVVLSAVAQWATELVGEEPEHEACCPHLWWKCECRVSKEPAHQLRSELRARIAELTKEGGNG